LGASDLLQLYKGLHEKVPSLSDLDEIARGIEQAVEDQNPMPLTSSKRTAAKVQ
jgi:hypothetical protein